MWYTATKRLGTPGLKHKILLNTKKAKQQVSLENANKSSAGTSTIENYFKPTKESLERIVAELAALDRVSFNTISTSKQLKQAFLERGYKLPQTVQNVGSIIISFSQTLKSDIKKMTKIKRELENFVLSLLMNTQAQEAEDT